MKRFLLVCLSLVVLGVGVVTAGGKQEAQKAAVPEAAPGNEAPQLARLVETGELPSLEQRLPEEPLVVHPLETDGRYGGSWNRVDQATSGGWYFWEPFVKLDTDTLEPMPNVARSWDINEDYTRFTFHLRPGMKWSDGEPFTSDDFLFWYNDVLMNGRLTPAVPGWLIAGGEAGRVTAPDRYTVVFEFAAPKVLFLQEQAGMGRNNQIMLPKHYLSQFHADHADETTLNAAVRAEGMEDWVQLLNAKMAWNNHERPILTAWVMETDTSAATQRAVRNPYYWKVDPSGRQLPYIDEMVWPQRADGEVMLLRAIGGQVDFDRVSRTAGDMIVLRENEARGGYNAKMLNLDSHANSLVLAVNQDFQGEAEIAELLRNVLFRRAVSVALDRDEINEFALLGLAEPHQSVLHPHAPGGSVETATAYIEFDPDQANRWLDEIGMTQRDGDGFRRLPSGTNFTLVIDAHISRTLNVDSAEILERQLRRVGLNAVVRLEDDGYVNTRRDAGQHMMMLGNNGEGVDPLRKPWEYFPMDIVAWAPLQGLHYVTGGRDGVAPSGYMVELLDLYDQVTRELDPAGRARIYERVMEIHSQQLFQIGTMTFAGFPVVVSNRMRNTPERLANAYQNSPAMFPEQFFLTD